MTTGLAAPPVATEAPAGGRRTRRTRITAAITVALAAAVSLLAVPLASPAHAVGVCTASTRAAFWYDPYSVQLIRTTNCRYYTKLVIDNGIYGVGNTISIKVERSEKTPYGWFVTETKSKTTAWGEGSWSTATVDGWYPTAWEGEDRHRACYRWNSGSWTCTGWVSI